MQPDDPGAAEVVGRARRGSSFARPLPTASLSEAAAAAPQRPPIPLLLQLDSPRPPGDPLSTTAVEVSPNFADLNLPSSDFLNELVKQLGPDATVDESHAATTQLLGSIVSRFQATMSPTGEHLNSLKFCTDFLDTILVESQSPGNRIRCLGLLFSMLQQLSSSGCDSDDEEEATHSSEHGVLVQRVIESMDQFYSLLKTPPAVAEVVTSISTFAPPLGTVRLKVIELFWGFFCTPYSALHQRIFETGAVELILEHFFHYEWNSLLHNQVVTLYICLVNSKVEETRRQIFERCRPVSRILAAYNDARTAREGSPQKRWRGYMAQLFQLAKATIDASHSDPWIASHLEGTRPLLQALICPCHQAKRAGLPQSCWTPLCINIAKTQ
eukprot:gnl/Hemi2/20958_TR6948_c0_g3_i1.p1 gnl/Hemi2/20958_TR6948_c0_g3~~gnl/Hemi2/20958_TR6948_c0_g3_i1.p1  ORF type:complete len:384 (-),score=23.51 gnl/Hemi2/20958_TR6948_c0_g3_i1:39-1190(-)